MVEFVKGMCSLTAVLVQRLFARTLRSLSAYKDIENELTLRSLVAKELPKKTVNESNFGHPHFIVKTLIPSKPTN